MYLFIITLNYLDFKEGDYLLIIPLIGIPNAVEAIVDLNTRIALNRPNNCSAAAAAADVLHRYKINCNIACNDDKNIHDKNRTLNVGVFGAIHVYTAKMNENGKPYKPLVIGNFIHLLYFEARLFPRVSGGVGG